MFKRANPEIWSYRRNARDQPCGLAIGTDQLSKSPLVEFALEFALELPFGLLSFAIGAYQILKSPLVC
jgi:hypothetical protein